MKYGTVEYHEQTVEMRKASLARLLERDSEYRAQHGDKEADRIIKVYRADVKRAETWLAKARARIA